MKSAKITPEKIERAIRFLERRREFAERSRNTRWAEEYENALNIMCGLSAVPRTACIRVVER
jgi:hypothetical protein